MNHNKTSNTVQLTLCHAEFHSSSAREGSITPRFNQNFHPIVREETQYAGVPFDNDRTPKYRSSFDEAQLSIKTDLDLQKHAHSHSHSHTSYIDYGMVDRGTPVEPSADLCPSPVLSEVSESTTYYSVDGAYEELLCPVCEQRIDVSPKTVPAGTSEPEDYFSSALHKTLKRTKSLSPTSGSAPINTRTFSPSANPYETYAWMTTHKSCITAFAELADSNSDRRRLY